MMQRRSRDDKGGTEWARVGIIAHGSRDPQVSELGKNWVSTRQ